jgi:AraC-like DNA-binding protein
MIVFISITVLLFTGILFFNNWKQNRSVAFLAIYLLSYSIFPVSFYYTYIAKDTFWLAIFLNNFTPLYLLGGPCLYFYVKGTIEDKLSFKWLDTLHLIPAVIYFIGTAPYLFSSFEYKLQTATAIIENIESIKTIRLNWILPFKLNFLFRPIIVCGYIIAAYRILYVKAKSLPAPSRQFKLIARWIMILLTTSLVLMILYLAVSSLFNERNIKNTLQDLDNLHFVTVGIVMIVPVSMLLFPQILYGLPNREQENSSLENNPSKNLTEPIQRNNEAFKKLSETILNYFDKEKPFLKQNFNLTDLASALKVPQHHISYCFSDFIEMSFTKLRATKRVDYAKELMLQTNTKEISLDQIAERSGFSSRSSFFSSFKEFTGMTPSEFLGTTQQ